MDGSIQTRLFVLQKGTNYDNKVYRLKKGWRLSFARDPTLQMDDVRLFTNYPMNGKAIDYSCYTELTWVDDKSPVAGYSVVSSEIDLISAGSFRFYYTVDGSNAIANADGQGYLLVDPQLTVGTDDTELPLDAVQQHTVLPKLLGTLDEWPDRLKVSYKSGYNMIHFTPLQTLNSESNSSYSIADQLEINPNFFPTGGHSRDDRWKQVAALVNKLNTDWSVLSVTDMVYNHTANDSAWLIDHPDGAYNLTNSPHLKPAYLLDCLVSVTSNKIANGLLEGDNLSATSFTSTNVTENLGSYLHSAVRELRLEEFYIVEADQVMNDFSQALSAALPTIRNIAQRVTTAPESEVFTIQQDPTFRRMKSTIAITGALKYFTNEIIHLVNADADDSTIMDVIMKKMRDRVDFLNKEKLSEVQGHVDAAVSNILSGINYRFVDDGGMKIKKVTTSEPLVEPYFVNKNSSISSSRSLQDEEKLLEDDKKCCFVMAHNGWVMNDDPMRDFAKPGSNVYLRRELVVWGDSVKLHYGDKPADSPELWKRMEEYTRRTVQIFHGIRLDNCHSTPIHVAEHMMRLARQVRPDVYVFAELFTSHEDLDNVFVNRLGLNSLIREGLAAWDAHEQGRMVYKYGGQPVASFFQPKCQLMKPSVAHALFMDATHDNEAVAKKRTVEDSVSLAAFVAMASCATGSNRGYDELVPHHISVVSEKRLYQEWQDRNDDNTELLAGVCDSNTGIIAIKKALNDIHCYLGKGGFDQVYVHDLSSDVVSITRHNPSSHQTVIGVMRSAFDNNGSSHPACDSLRFEGGLEEVMLYARLVPPSGESHHRKHGIYINGLSGYTAICETAVSIGDVPGVSFGVTDDGRGEIVFNEFPKGSVLILKIQPPADLVSNRKKIFQNIEILQDCQNAKQKSKQAEKLSQTLSALSLIDLHDVLFNCEAEEKANTGFGAYHIPSYGALVYTGLQGIVSPLSKISDANDLGHPICQNLRDGDWLMDYITARMRNYPSLNKLAEHIEELFSPIKSLPRYLIPCYFDITMSALSSLINTTVLTKMMQHSDFIKNGSHLVKDLALSSQQFCGVVKSAQLAPVEDAKKTVECHPVSLAAGLPHFSEGIFRIWGRDTFISLRGLLLVTGRFHEARAIILSFAGTLRHGLIPNLLGEGIKARYNCRDAVWWWLQAIQDYYKLAPDGNTILKQSVIRLYPTDDCEEPVHKVQLLSDVMQEALQRHADGIRFTERNAGSGIDEHMSWEGFQVEAGINWYTGFVYGGNASNCGTWMDKMGSSAKAGNKGKPATPRNGSAVELVALCASAVKWLAELNGKSVYPYSGVFGKRPNWSTRQEIPFTVWYNLIQRNFESYFWVDGTYTSMETEPKPHLINRKHIYKDSINADPEWADYQLRPNFVVAVAVAPDLFTPVQAMSALSAVEKHLVGPLGLKTLDPSDWAYCGDYHNDDDSDNSNTAAGFNYHQGPEWIWPYGYYLRANLVVAQRMEDSKPGLTEHTIKRIHDKLALHQLAMSVSDWRSLPELTNSNGQECKDSCPAQAWSVSCLLDVLFDIYKLKNK